MKKQLLIATSSLLIAGAGSSAVASAQTTTNSIKPHVKMQHHGMSVRLEARLNQAEKDGTITSAQKTALETELKNIRSEHQSSGKANSKMTQHTEHIQQKTELKAWAKANNFPLDKVFPKISS